MEESKKVVFKPIESYEEFLEALNLILAGDEQPKTLSQGYTNSLMQQEIRKYSSKLLVELNQNKAKGWVKVPSYKLK